MDRAKLQVEIARRRALQEICALCHESVDSLHSVPVSIPQCLHRAHTICLRHWCLVSATCPTCRVPIVSPPETADELSARMRFERLQVVDRQLLILRRSRRELLLAWQSNKVFHKHTFGSNLSGMPDYGPNFRLTNERIHDLEFERANLNN